MEQNLEEIIKKGRKVGASYILDQEYGVRVDIVPEGDCSSAYLRVVCEDRRIYSKFRSELEKYGFNVITPKEESTKDILGLYKVSNNEEAKATIVKISECYEKIKK